MGTSSKSLQSRSNFYLYYKAGQEAQRPLGTQAVDQGSRHQEGGGSKEMRRDRV